mmetsp:Transcript_66113/g.187763  ORF Transcript_66113/g.187763 Transcript_66113/m.187763 type:complete len:201 (-) Transcript_66113:317-919(-)
MSLRFEIMLLRNGADMSSILALAISLLSAAVLSARWHSASKRSEVDCTERSTQLRMSSMASKPALPTSTAQRRTMPPTWVAAMLQMSPGPPLLSATSAPFETVASAVVAWDLFWKHLGVSITPSDGVASRRLSVLRPPGEARPAGEANGDVDTAAFAAMSDELAILSLKPCAWKSLGTVATASVGVDSGSDMSDAVRVSL